MTNKKNKDNLYSDDELSRVSGAGKLHNKDQQHDKEYNSMMLDEFEDENPDLAAWCRQMMPK